MSAAVLTFTLKAKDEATRVVKGVMGVIKDDVKALDSTVGKLAQSFGFSDGKAIALAKTLPMVGAAVGAVAGVATAAGAAIFTLTKNASDAGSEIFEAGQKSNLSAEFLSVLKVQAEQSGSSFEGATSKVVKWGNSLVDAARGNKDLIADLKRFGIDAADAYRNPEAALKTFIEQFNRLPPSAANNEAAMRLFKDRSGELIPVLRAFGSDYEGLVRKLDASGQIWTQEGVEKADEFGDALTELGQIASGIGNTFARELMPEITSTMKDISESVTANRDAFRTWGREVGDVIRGVRELADSHLGKLVGLLAQVAYYTSPAAMLVSQTAAIGGAARDAEALKNFGPFGGRGVATPLTRGTPGAGTMAAGDVTNEAAAKAAARQREQQRQLERRAAEKDLAEEVAMYRRFNQMVGELLDEPRREAEESDKRREAIEKKTADDRLAASEAVRDAIRAEIALLTEENTHLTVINDTIRRAEILGAIDARTAAWLRQLAAINAIADKINDVAPPVGGDVTIPHAPGQKDGPFVDPAEFTKEFGEPPAPTFDLWEESLNGLKGVAKGVFGGITQGFGGMIQAFLMGEKGAAKSFGAIAKAAISSMAAQASVSALFELAQGFAWLFINPPKAASHFQAAAVFGIVAGAAGIASALIPGGGSETGAAFGTGTTFGGGFGASPQDSGPRVVEQSRNTPPQVIILRLEPGLVAQEVTNDVRRNGPLRNLIIETAAA